MTNEEIENIISNLDLDHFILDRESVLKNNSMEKTAENVVREMLPNIQLRMMNLSETDINHFIRMETRREDNTLDNTEDDYFFEYVSDKFYDDIEKRCENQNLWSTKEEYKEKWKKQFPEPAKEIDEVVSTLSKEIENGPAQMEEERKKKVVDINFKNDTERRLNYLASTRKIFIEEFDRFLVDQMEYDNEDVYEDLCLEVTKRVEKEVEKEARLIVQPYIVQENAEGFKNASSVIPTSKK